MFVDINIHMLVLFVPFFLIFEVLFLQYLNVYMFFIHKMLFDFQCKCFFHYLNAKIVYNIRI